MKPVLILLNETVLGLLERHASAENKDVRKYISDFIASSVTNTDAYNARPFLQYLETYHKDIHDSINTQGEPHAN